MEVATPKGRGGLTAPTPPAASPAPPKPPPIPGSGHNGGGTNGKTSPSPKLGDDPKAKRALENVKITSQGSGTDTSPTSLAPPQTTAATPKAIAASAPNLGVLATNGGVPANTPAPAPPPEPVPSPALPAPGPAAPETAPGQTANAPAMAHAVESMLSRGQQEDPAEVEPPPATSQSGSAAAVAPPGPPPASEPSEEERDPDAEMKRLFNSLLQRALSDPGTRQAIAASFGSEVSRLLDRALKPINDRLQAPQPVPATQQEVATIETKLRDHLDTQIAGLRTSLVTDITAKLAELGRPATLEDVKAAIDSATARMEQQVHDVGVAINGHTNTALETAVGNVNSQAEVNALALGGQVDAARAAAENAAQNAYAAAGHAENAANNLLGVGGNIDRLGQQLDGVRAAAGQFATGAETIANRLETAVANAAAPPPAAAAPTIPGGPDPDALGAGMGPSPVVGTGPGGQTVVAAGAPLPPPAPPARTDAYPLTARQREIQAVKIGVAIAAIVGILLAIIFL